VAVPILLLEFSLPLSDECIEGFLKDCSTGPLSELPAALCVDVAVVEVGDFARQ
jgi:hypothetical protein